MNGMSRFLSRREKNHEKHNSKGSRSKSRLVPTEFYNIFSNEGAKKPDKEEEKKVKVLVQRLNSVGITMFGETQAEYALTKNPDNSDKAFELLVLAADSFDGILKEYDPNVTMLGAENRQNVTCYLDALLFAMFARLDSFEAMLFDSFTDEPRKKLAAMLRLWVNLLRTGKLITVDLTKHLQDALGKCGWEEATQLCQQDASEAFTFITGKLELPLLTLKMDIYHTGKEDAADDHKFVNERLLEVAIPSEREDGRVITLEDCLETYFNNRIEVKRHLQRRNTAQSVRSTDTDKGQTMHIEAAEVSSGPNSPTISTPATSLAPISPIRPVDGRRRADSIFSERYVESKEFSEKKLLEEMSTYSGNGRPRGGSLLRKEVMMPAWQFFSLIPWYTDNAPTSDAQVAAHFSAKRPVLGICLKRYSMLPNGTPQRLSTYIDIPLEIGLPHFISDDRMEEEGPLFGNFKLSLQSVVCHRGVSVNSGHYVALIRANVPDPWPSKAMDGRPGSSETDDAPNAWMRFDDLAKERVIDVDIKQALKDESPYLLFYQVQPVDEELARGNPPSYAKAQSEMASVDPSLETLTSTDAETTIDGMEWDRSGTVDLSHLDANGPDEAPSRTSMSSNHRSSVTFEDLEGSLNGSTRGRAALTTPADESKPSFLSASRRGSKVGKKTGSKSRPTSQSGESRLGFTMSRLSSRKSKDKLQILDNATSDEPIVTVVSVGSVAEDAPEPAPQPAHHIKYSSLGGSKSTKGKEKKRLRSSSRNPPNTKNHHKKPPDRECIVM
ncbi:cysteine proteinase [Cenococcum geophilum 1.58]|uniref:cysteine proteinase n=1 Tax=Cenococcum geophilum 1.58 TaxID=794803 RepID=UPI00358EA1FD|nr:cysteine proteinase [Cenococcum geophilum 1.58]